MKNEIILSIGVLLGLSIFVNMHNTIYAPTPDKASNNTNQNSSSPIPTKIAETLISCRNMGYPSGCIETARKLIEEECHLVSNCAQTQNNRTCFAKWLLCAKVSNENECLELYPTKDHQYFWCVAAVAITKKDLKLCDLWGDDFSDCYLVFALANGNVSVCKLVLPSRLNGCMETYIRDAEYTLEDCTKIKQIDDTGVSETNCINQLFQSSKLDFNKMTMSDCDEIRTMHGEIAQKCYINLAKRTYNTTHCMGNKDCEFYIEHLRK